MSTAATVLSITTNLYLLYEVYHYFKQTQELRDEVMKKNKRIWNLEDALRKKEDELKESGGIRNRSRKKL